MNIKTKLLTIAIVFVSFVVVYLMQTQTKSRAATSCTVGDLNGNGAVSISDFEFFRRNYIAGINPTIPVPTGGEVATIPANPKIMPLGDSITVGMHGAGSDWGANHSTRGGYRAKFEELMSGAGYTYDMVGSNNWADETESDRDNEGHGGWCISGGNNTCFGDFSDPSGNAGLLAHVDSWLGTYQPDVVLLHIGTNDLSGGGLASDAIANYSQLIDKILADRPQVFLFVSNLEIEGNTQVASFNTQLASLVTQKSQSGAHVYYVDTYAGMTPPLHESPDTLHPTLSNYEIMGANWFNAVQAHMPGQQVSATSTPPPITGGDHPVGLVGNFSKVWGDEFDSFNTQNWTRTYPWDTSGVESRATDAGTGQIIDPANVQVSNGILKMLYKKIPAETINGLTREWSTGMMHTRGKVEFKSDTRGTYIEVRSKQIRGNGLWSFAWLLPSDFAQDPNCQVQRYTLKLQETNGKYPNNNDYNVKRRVSCTISATSLQDDLKAYDAGTDLSTAFHVYGMDWYPDHIDYYFDGQKIFTSTAISTVDGPGFLIINGYVVTNIGLNDKNFFPFDGVPDVNTPTQTQYEVDYVRAWKRI